MRTAEAQLQLETFLPYRLSVLSNIVSTRIARVYSSQFGLSIPEWRVIAVLAMTPGLSSGDVAQRTAMDKVMVSRAVSRLLKAGRIEKRVGSVDRRSSHLTLSAKGRLIYAKVVPLAKGIEARLIGALGPEEGVAFTDAMTKLLEAAPNI